MFGVASSKVMDARKFTNITNFSEEGGIGSEMALVFGHES